MMSSSISIEDWAKEEIQLLVAEATKLVNQTDTSHSGMNGSDSAKLVQSGTRACKLIEDLYGRTNTRSKQIRNLIASQGFSNAWEFNNDHVRSLLGILQAVEHDIENNRVPEVRVLIRAEVFADFLEMADYLLEEKYKDAAAVIAGGVLENALRSLATRWNISLVDTKNKPLTIGPLNDALSKAGAYNALEKKRINLLAGVRNAAAHGQYNEYDKDDVAEMIRFVTRFANE